MSPGIPPRGEGGAYHAAPSPEQEGVQRQCFSTVGKYMTKIKEYIANQMKEDKMTEQMTITELLGMFKQ